MREILRKSLISDPEIELIGAAADPYEARDLIRQLNPDVLILDIMLPHMDGITFLRNIMRLRPMPVVIVSSLTKEKQSTALEAFELGAIDYLAKPSLQDSRDLAPFTRKLIQSVKIAANSNIHLRAEELSSSASYITQVEDILTNNPDFRSIIVAIGASTGGVEALESILSVLPKFFPAVLIVLHIHKEFISSFTQRINKLCNLSVKEVSDGEAILPDNIYVAPSDFHFIIKDTDKGYIARLIDTPAVSGHKPSIDVLFESVSKVAGRKSVGVLLTGMGKDGSVGLKAIKDSGGTTIAQDKATSIVWGMPGSAVKLNAVDYIVPLHEIPQKILNCLDLKLQDTKI